MKLMKKLFLAATAGLMVFMSFSCASVTRVEAGEEVELDGYWSDTDVKNVCTDIIGQVLESPRVARFNEDNGRDPIVTIGKIRNDSDEYIDTEIISNNLKTAIIKSGRLEFMANSKDRDALRNEIADQADHADMDQAKEFDMEDAADFMLSGSVKTMVQYDGKKTSFRTYYVTIELNDVESARTIDIFEPAPENQPRKIFKGKRR